MKTFKIFYKWQNKITPAPFYFEKGMAFEKANSAEDAAKQFAADWHNESAIYEITSIVEC